MSVSNYADDAAVRQIWTATKRELAKKVNLTTLADYSNTEQVQVLIATSLLDYMTADQISAAINTAIAGVIQFNYAIVENLPAAGRAGTIYLVPNGQNGGNSYNEYLWIDGKFELIGTTQVDLSQYYSKSELVPITQAQLDEILV